MGGPVGEEVGPSRLPSFVAPGRLITGSEGALLGYFLTTYTRCEMRCLYCCTNAQGASTPHVGRDRVAEQLRLELQSIPRGAPLGIGCASDAYPDVERELGVTRRVLEVLVELEWPFYVITKGLGVERDVDLLAGSGAHVQISVGSADDRRLAELEPHVTATASERIALVHRLVDRGVDTLLNAAPWIPGVSDVAALLDRVPPTVPVGIAPLEVGYLRGGRIRGTVWSQIEVDDAYLSELERVGLADNAGWRHPILHPEFDIAPLGHLAAGPVFLAWLGAITRRWGFDAAAGSPLLRT